MVAPSLLSRGVGVGGGFSKSLWELQIRDVSRTALIHVLVDLLRALQWVVDEIRFPLARAMLVSLWQGSFSKTVL